MEGQNTQSQTRRNLRNAQCNPTPNTPRQRNRRMEPRNSSQKISKRAKDHFSVWCTYMRYCKKCGSQVKEEDNFCSKCGTSLRNSKIGYIRRASIGPHPVWSILSGVMLVLSGFVSIYLLATAFEPLPILSNFLSYWYSLY